MTVTFYYLPASPPVRSVDLVVHALGLSVQYKTVDFLKLETSTPEYLKINPLHTIPAIDDDGFVLWESRAIMTYLVSKYGKDDSLYPKDLQKRAIIDQRLHYSNDVFYLLKQICRSILFDNVKSVSSELAAKVQGHQENVEKLLQGNKFIAGDSLTVADYSFITLMDVLELFSPTKGKFPLTKTWSDRCKSTMKDFNKVNEEGGHQFISAIKNKMTS